MISAHFPQRTDKMRSLLHTKNWIPSLPIYLAVLMLVSSCGPTDERRLDQAKEAAKRGDHTTALGQMQPLAENGNAEAQLWLAYMKAHGLGTNKDAEAALQWLQKSVDQKDPESQYFLAGLLEYGSSTWNLKSDVEQAFELMHASAEQGFVEAEYKLGNWYGKPFGNPRDLDQSIYWLSRAAEKGHANAQNNLGTAVRDASEAAEWYRKAAEQGNSAGQSNLARLYRDGRGVPQDYVLAHMWFNLAAQQSPDVRQAVEEIAELMTPGQIEEAQRRAQEWRMTQEP